jgi:hypothetical protein
MITNYVHGQFVRLSMRLPADIRAKTICLWREGLLVGRMRGDLYVSEENRRSGSSIDLHLVLSANWGHFL